MGSSPGQRLGLGLEVLPEELPEVINMKLLPIIFIHYSASKENILTYQVEDATLI